MSDANNYTYLKAGDILSYDDEQLSKDGETWHPVNYFLTGKTLKVGDVKYRRPRFSDPLWEPVRYFDELSTHCEFYNVALKRWQTLDKNQVLAGWSHVGSLPVLRRPRKQTTEAAQSNSAADNSAEQKQTQAAIREGDEEWIRIYNLGFESGMKTAKERVLGYIEWMASAPRTLAHIEGVDFAVGMIRTSIQAFFDEQLKRSGPSKP